jgi:Exostosin family
MCTDHYRHWSGEQPPAEQSKQQQVYVETMLASKFILCPRGAGAASIRLFEAMELGCAPVVIADSWIPVDGVDWSFCLFVKESQIFEMDAIIRAHEHEWQERGAAARRAFDAHFAQATFGPTLERQLQQLVSDRKEGRERLVRAFYPLYRGAMEAKWRLRMQLRNAVLAGFRLLGRKFPYDLNR